MFYLSLHLIVTFAKISNMENKELMEGFGFIVKKEKLASLASDHNYHELILEDIAPFPGFYDHFHVPNEQELKPRSLFFIIKGFDVCNEDQFVRKTIDIKKTFPHEFDAVLGQLELFNKIASCIRINLNNYGVLPELVEAYKQQGVVFYKHKNVKPYQSLIKLRKYYDMEKVDEGIYKDRDQACTYYLHMPVNVAWKDFETLTYTIKNNTSFSNFDAAQSSIYRKTGLMDFVRIYHHHINIDRLHYLRDTYRKEIARMEPSVEIG